jgi:DNA polymerase-3 subunit gamma/tau
MSYTVIARKWRPQTFDDVVGQDHVVRTLRNAVRTGRIAQAYLLVGPRGTGKTTLARIFSKALNCKDGPTENPCGVCAACKEIASGSSLDVNEIDGASNNKVEDVHAIRESVNFAPVLGKFRITYIDEVHMLSGAAFNALLKTLEEPPAHAKFIFATTEPEKLPATIISRCQRFDLRRIPVPLIVERLRVITDDEKITVSDEALLAIARGAEGGMRDAQSALDQLIAFTGSNIEETDVLNVFGLVARKSLEDLAGAVLAGDIGGALALVDELDRGGKDLRRLTVELIDHFRNLLVFVHGGGKGDGLDLTDAQVEALAAQAKGAKSSNLLQVVEILIDLENRLRYALSRRTLLEAALMRAARSATAVPLEEILKRLQALQTELGPAAPQSSTAARIPTDVPPKKQHHASGNASPKTQQSTTMVRETSASAAEPLPKPVPNHTIAARPAVKAVIEVLGGTIVDIQ